MIAAYLEVFLWLFGKITPLVLFGNVIVKNYSRKRRLKVVRVKVSLYGSSPLSSTKASLIGGKVENSRENGKSEKRC